MNSKLLADYKQYIAEIVVDSVVSIDSKYFDKTRIKILKVLGGDISQSLFIDGIVFKKTFSYAGFE